MPLNDGQHDGYSDLTVLCGVDRWPQRAPCMAAVPIFHDVENQGGRTKGPHLTYSTNPGWCVSVPGRIFFDSSIGVGRITNLRSVALTSEHLPHTPTLSLSFSRYIIQFRIQQSHSSPTFYFAPPPRDFFRFLSGVSLHYATTSTQDQAAYAKPSERSVSDLARAMSWAAFLCLPQYFGRALRIAKMDCRPRTGLGKAFY